MLPQDNRLGGGTLRAFRAAAATLAATVLTACATGPELVQHDLPPQPNEQRKLALADYVVQPPDLLFVEVEALPSPDQVIRTGNSIYLSVPNTLDQTPIDNILFVDDTGILDLADYGQVNVKNLTVAQATAALVEQLARNIKEPKVRLSVIDVRPIQGEYLVRPDGRIKLGFYGELFVAGKTLTQIQYELAEFLQASGAIGEPRVSVDVAAYNSAVYYVVADGAGFGDQVVRQPLTGNETVLDAVAAIGGLPASADSGNIWISRPIPGDAQATAVLPVDWTGISKYAQMETNYQLQAGDRLYLKADALTRTDNFLARTFAPVERTLGLLTLFDITIDSLSGQNNRFGLGVAAPIAP